MAVALAGTAAAAAAAADIYRYVDEHGVVHFPNAPTRPEARKFFDAQPAVFGDDGRYDPLISELSRAHGVDRCLVKAVVRAESNFDPRAISRRGACGLMQLMPDTARELQVVDLFDPRQNLQAGIRYLQRLIDAFGGDLSLALAAYNAGPGAVQQHGAIPPFAETRRYVAQVLHYRDAYQSMP